MPITDQIHVLGSMRTCLWLSGNRNSIAQRKNWSKPINRADWIYAHQNECKKWIACSLSLGHFWQAGLLQSCGFNRWFALKLTGRWGDISSLPRLAALRLLKTRDHDNMYSSLVIVCENQKLTLSKCILHFNASATKGDCRHYVFGLFICPSTLSLIIMIT